MLLPHEVFQAATAMGNPDNLKRRHQWGGRVSQSSGRERCESVGQDQDGSDRSWAALPGTGTAGEIIDLDPRPGQDSNAQRYSAS